MATYFTLDFTAANGSPWPYFTERTGSAFAAEVQSNVGWNGGTAAAREFQAAAYPATRDYKWSVLADWLNAVTAGRWFGMGVRYTDDGDTCYWVQISSYRMSDNTLNMPHIRIYRRRGGADVEVVTEQDISGSITGADLNAGVTFQLRIETLEDSVTLEVLADKGAGYVSLYEYEDTNALRITSGGTVAIFTGSTSVNNDVTYDDVVAEDFADEATGGGEVTTGLSLVINGSHYDADEIAAMNLAGIRAKQSYAITVDGYISDLNDFHLHVLRPGDDIAIRYNDEWYARGVIRPMVQSGLIPEGTSYEIHGPKLLCRGVVVQHPDTGQGQVLFNADEEDPEYDANLADMSPGDILSWLYNNHAEGQDGLRAHKAAPASGTIVTVPAAMLAGPVIPGITVSGSFAEAVEYILSFMPQYAWHIDPETLQHSFIDRDASAATDVDAADEHTFIRLETRPDLNRTAVIIRGSKAESERTTVSTLTGDLIADWAAGLESGYTKSKARINRMEGTVAAFGAFGGNIYIDPTQTGGAFPLDAQQWDGCFLSVDMTGHGVRVFQVLTTSPSRLLLTSTAWPNGGTETPTIGDPIVLFGNRRTQNTVEGEITNGKNNGYWDLYRSYYTSAGNLADGECFRVTLTIPTGAGDGVTEDLYETVEVGGRIQNGRLVLDEPALLPVGLINYLPGRDGSNCGVGTAQGVGQNQLGNIEAEVPVETGVAPYVRVPASGFRGTAYAFDDAKWDGGGEAGYGDPGVMDPLVIDDPNFQYQTEQEGDYEALADALLTVFGTLAIAAEITRTDIIEGGWLGLDAKATISDTASSRTTGYEASEDLWLAEVEWDFEAWQTVIRIGNMVSFGGVNIQAVRQRFAENQRIKQFRDFIERQSQIVNCLKEGSQQAAGAGLPASTGICASDVRTVGGGTMAGEHHEIVSDTPQVFVPTHVCDPSCDAIDTNKAALIANAADVAADIPILSQPVNRDAPVPGEAYIEAVVACVQSHVSLLNKNLYNIVVAIEGAFAQVEICFANTEGAIGTMLSCLNTNDGLLLQNDLVLEGCLQTSVYAGPGIICKIPNHSLDPCVYGYACGSVCECPTASEALSC